MNRIQALALAAFASLAASIAVTGQSASDLEHACPAPANAIAYEALDDPACLVWTGTHEEWCQRHAAPGCTPCPNQVTQGFGYGDSPISTRVCLGPGQVASIEWGAMTYYSGLLDGDADNDGEGDQQETIVSGSNPFEATSKALTDDDGDGLANKDECVPASFQTCIDPTIRSYTHNACTGAYGIQAAPSCLPTTMAAYGSSGSVSTVNGGNVRVHNGEAYVWDGICLNEDDLDYAACRATSTYAWPPVHCTAPGPCKAATWNAGDGYGWVKAGANQGPVPMPDQQTPVVDADGDLLPVSRVCPATITLANETPTVHQDRTQCTLYGDPDDGDAANPNPQGGAIAPWRRYAENQTRLADDVDHDGTSNSNESVAGSHFNDPASTPTTDDDGDATLNGAEPDAGAPRGRSLCTGAYGIVQSPGACGGYPGARLADGCTTAPEAYPFICRASTHVWLWDPICTRHDAAGHINYPTCRTTTLRTRTVTSPYTGNYVDDGYGWRYATSGVTNVEIVPVPRGNNPVVDEDGDKFPVLWTCKRTVTVTVTGSYTVGAEQDCTATSIDPDDHDATVPTDAGYPVRTVQQAIEDLEDQLRPVQESAKAYANTTQAQVMAYVNGTLTQVAGVLHLINNTGQDVGGLVAALYTQLMQANENATQAVLWELALVQELLGDAGICLQSSTNAYLLAMTAAAQRFIANPTQAESQTMTNAMQAASGQWQGEAIECYNNQELGPVANGVVALAVQGALTALDQALTVIKYSRAATNDTAAFVGTLNSTVPAITRGMADAVTATSNATMQFVLTLEGIVRGYVEAFDVRALLDDETRPPQSSLTTTSSTSSSTNATPAPHRTWSMPFVAVGTGTVVLAALWFTGRR